jgi:hypothetical protein
VLALAISKLPAAERDDGDPRNIYLAWGHHHSLRRPICIKVFCKPIKHLFTLRTTRWTWSAR